MAQKQLSKASDLAGLIDTKDLLKMVVGKISSQLLLFSVAIIVFLIVSYFLFGNDGLWISIAILFVFIFASIGYLFVEQKRKIVSGEPEAIREHLSAKVENISNTNDNFKIEVWTSKVHSAEASSRDIAVVPKHKGSDAAYRIGEKILLCFRSSRDCYLTLLNIGTSGKLTVLFPNRMHPDNFIEANTLYEIPDSKYGFDYELQGPPGIEKVKAVATLQKTDLIESDFTSEGIFKTTGGTSASRDIAVVAQKLEPVSKADWSETSYQFEVRN